MFKKALLAVGLASTIVNVVSTNECTHIFRKINHRLLDTRVYEVSENAVPTFSGNYLAVAGDVTEEELIEALSEYYRNKK